MSQAGFIEEFHGYVRSGDLQNAEKCYEIDSSIISTNNKSGFPPIVIAAYNEQYEITQWLLEQGAAVDARDSAGNTALMGICFKGYEDIADLLLTYKSDINAKNLSGATALIYALTFGQMDMFKFLLKKGADKNIKDGSGKTALIHAESMKNAVAIELLST
jgi:ankyrin repeat protein